MECPRSESSVAACAQGLHVPRGCCSGQDPDEDSASMELYKNNRQEKRSTWLLMPWRRQKGWWGPEWGGQSALQMRHLTWALGWKEHGAGGSSLRGSKAGRSPSAQQQQREGEMRARGGERPWRAGHLGRWRPRWGAPGWAGARPGYIRCSGANPAGMCPNARAAESVLTELKQSPGSLHSSLDEGGLPTSTASKSKLFRRVTLEPLRFSV